MNNKNNKKHNIKKIINRINFNTQKYINQIYNINVKHKFYIESELNEINNILNNL